MYVPAPTNRTVRLLEQCWYRAGTCITAAILTCEDLNRLARPVQSQAKDAVAVVVLAWALAVAADRGTAAATALAVRR